MLMLPRRTQCLIPDTSPWATSLRQHEFLVHGIDSVLEHAFADQTAELSLEFAGAWWCAHGIRGG